MKRFSSGMIVAAILILLAGRPGLAGDLDTDPALVGWWKLDETSGTTAADASSRGHVGQLEGGRTFAALSVPGRVGKALKCDGNDGGLLISGFKGVTGTAPRTVAAWINTETPKGDIVSWGTDDAGKMWTVGFIREHLGVTPKGGYLYMKAGVHDGRWHHVAFVVRPVELPNLHDDVKLYLDGTPAEIDDIGLLDLWPIETGDNRDVRIGQRYKGLIDDLRLYGRALSEDEVGALFRSAGNPPTNPGK